MGKENPVFSQAEEKIVTAKNSQRKTIALGVEAVGNKVKDLTAMLYKQSEEMRKLQALLDAEKKRADKAEQDAAAWKAKFMQAKQNTQACKKMVWDLQTHLNSVTEFVSDQNSEYGKLCTKSYLDIQQLLGNERAGVETREQRKDLLHAMRRFVSARSREQETAVLPVKSAPPENWQMGPELQKLMMLEKKGFQPERMFRLLVEKLLVVLESGSGEQITEALHSCGVEVVFYDDAPSEFRESDFYGYYDSGIDVPALVGRKADSGAIQVLSRGAHVIKADRE